MITNNFIASVGNQMIEINFIWVILFFFILFALAIISLILKGYSLWEAARRSEKNWFIALLLLNTMGILELYYLYAVVGKWKKIKDTPEKI